MSYDFDLYIKRQQMFKPPRTSIGCNVVLYGPDKIQNEDIPRSYQGILGNNRILYKIHIEGVLSKNDREVLNKWLRGLILDAKGILIDLQTETFETARKAGKIASTESSVDSCGWGSFYFTHGEEFYESGFETMLGCISKTMPEALPRRYGYYEPLQECIENGIFSELLASFRKKTDILLKSQTPFGDILISIPCRKTFETYHPQHFIRREFLMGTVSFQLRPKIFSNPSRLETVDDLFERLCVLLDVSYAEITKKDQPGSWFWYGLPDQEPISLCIGSAYQQVWPEISEVGREIGTHHRVVSTDRFGNTPPRPPTELLAPDQGERNPGSSPYYAQVFPFDYCFDYNKFVW